MPRSVPFVPCLLAAVVSCRGGDRTITGGQEGANDLRRALQRATPAGMPLDSARAYMVHNGFACQLEHDGFAAFPIPDSTDFLYCDKRVRGGVIDVRWQTAHALQRRAVTDVFVTRGLIGP